MTQIEYAGRGGLAEALANGRQLLRSNPRAAAAQAEEILRRGADVAAAHRLLGAALRRLGREREADQSDLEAIAAAEREPALLDARVDIANGRLEDAERLLRPYLDNFPDDPVALHLLALIGARAGHGELAEQLLRRALQAAPKYGAARSALEAMEQRRTGSGVETPPAPASPESGGDEHAEAIRIYEAHLQRTPQQARGWVNYGHLLRTAGRQDEAVGAYREALRHEPMLGQAWWSLADLKTIRLSDEDVAVMQAALASATVGAEERICLHYALGKALEDAARPAEAFAHYETGANLRRKIVTYDAAALDAHVAKCERLFTPALFAERDRHGDPARDPIFILGMPRSGSTLIEQMLSSHPQVEGTMELPDIPNLAKVLSEGKDPGGEESPYAEALAALPLDQLDRLGAAYLWGTKLKRRSARPFFIDKMPNNWLHLGLILTILPNAKVIDARRHPLACCFSNFKQNFAHGQAFTFDLAELGGYYRNYVRMLAHLDAVLPGRIHRVIYEDLVANPEAELRRLLDYLGLPFDEACLRFHENIRAVKTSSSEQVRRPINRGGLDQWQPFEPWLGPLKDALGPVLEYYPGIPSNWD